MRNLFFMFSSLFFSCIQLYAQEDLLLPPKHFYFVDFTCSTFKTPTHEDYFMLTGDKTDTGLNIEALQVKRGDLLFLINTSNAQYNESTDKITVSGITSTGAQFYFEYMNKPEMSENELPIHKGYFSLVHQKQVIGNDELYCLERQNIQ